MPKDAKAGTPAARTSSIMSLLSGWVQQGIESFFATQRILVDLAIRQNSNVMKSVRNAFSEPEYSPAAILSELVVEGTANFIEAQRILLDLAQKENEIVLNGVKERVGISSSAVAMTDLVRRSIDTFVEMQQEFLTIASKQTQHWLHATKGGKPFDGGQLVEIAREGMENFMRTQKKFLDVIAEETENAVSGKHATGKKIAVTEIGKLAKEASDSFIDTQKKLLDLAGQQMHVNLQAAGRAIGMISPARLPIATITTEGVKTFVDAEKALIDTMLKPRDHKAAPKPEPRPKVHPKAKKAETAQAASIS
jgi:hypothetical protein